MQMAFWDHVVALRALRAGFSHKYLQSERGIGAPEKPVRRNDKNKRGWYLTLPRTLLYLVDAMKLRRAVARARAEHPGAIIFDRYIFDQLATLPMHRPLARAYARLVVSIVPRPDVAYLLDAEPEVARARKPEYPLEFMHRYRQSYLDLRELVGLTLIKPQSVEDTQHAIVARLPEQAGRPASDASLVAV
jgi:thymidylate kinase